MRAPRPLRERIACALAGRLLGTTATWQDWAMLTAMPVLREALAEIERLEQELKKVAASAPEGT